MKNTAKNRKAKNQPKQKNILCSEKTKEAMNVGASENFTNAKYSPKWEQAKEPINECFASKYVRWNECRNEASRNAKVKNLGQTEIVPVELHPE